MEVVVDGLLVSYAEMFPLGRNHSDYWGLDVDRGVSH